MCRYCGRFQILDPSLDCRFTMAPTPSSALTPDVMRRDLAYSISMTSIWEDRVDRIYRVTGAEGGRAALGGMGRQDGESVRGGEGVDNGGGGGGEGTEIKAGVATGTAALLPSPVPPCTAPCSAGSCGTASGSTG